MQVWKIKQITHVHSKSTQRTSFTASYEMSSGNPLHTPKPQKKVWCSTVMIKASRILLELISLEVENINI